MGQRTSNRPALTAISNASRIEGSSLRDVDGDACRLQSGRICYVRVTRAVNIASASGWLRGRARASLLPALACDNGSHNCGDDEHASSDARPGRNGYGNGGSVGSRTTGVAGGATCGVDGPAFNRGVGVRGYLGAWRRAGRRPGGRGAGGRRRPHLGRRRAARWCGRWGRGRRRSQRRRVPVRLALAHRSELARGALRRADPARARGVGLRCAECHAGAGERTQIDRRGERQAQRGTGAVRVLGHGLERRLHTDQVGKNAMLHIAQHRPRPT